MEFCVAELETKVPAKANDPAFNETIVAAVLVFVFVIVSV